MTSRRIESTIITTTVTLEKQQQQPRQLIPSSNDTAVAGGCLNDTSAITRTVTSSSMTFTDPQPANSIPCLILLKLQKFGPLSLTFAGRKNNGDTGFSKRQSRRTVTVSNGNCRVSPVENDRYQLSRQDASVSHVRRSPLGSYYGHVSDVKATNF
ncbi:BMA-TIR-1, isoform d [Dirofilaria immitis]|nr:BMA-TIR-1, isoform d [Dirofilaria immitis]